MARRGLISTGGKARRGDTAETPDDPNTVTLGRQSEGAPPPPPASAPAPPAE